AAFRALSRALAPAQVELSISEDLIDEIWVDRPGLPDAPVYEHLAPHACQPRAERLGRVRQAMAAKGADTHLVSTLDDIAWIFNLRGADVSYNPVFLAHALIGSDYATLFVAEGKIDDALAAALAADGVDVAPYALVAEALGTLEHDQTLLIDPARVTCGVFHAMDPQIARVEDINPSTLMKSRKSEAELANVREAMAQDGAALCEFFAWFEAAQGRETVTELTIDEQITLARARRPGYV
ncbi:aminopeptidase P family N-terminal domain-containing protein, partial [Bordetella holmesii]